MFCELLKDTWIAAEFNIKSRRNILLLCLLVGNSSSAPILMLVFDERRFDLPSSISTSTIKVPQTGRWSENLDSPRK